jgi:hypothetical protein
VRWPGGWDGDDEKGEGSGRGVVGMGSAGGVYGGDAEGRRWEAEGIWVGVLDIC